VTTPVVTLIDLATRVTAPELEAAVNEADKRDLVAPEQLRSELAARTGKPGTRPLRAILDRATFRLTDSELERLFLLRVGAAGLPPPLTQQRLRGGRADFYWPELGLVVETDGLRYHRTPSQQAKDIRRDQANAAAGLTTVRFTHWQVRHEPHVVRATLVAVAQRLAHRLDP
jgi:very-short-patch-repair endonuclease